MLAILPDALVESRGWGDRLCRLATEIVRDTPLCTARRPSLSKAFPAEAVVDALRRAVPEQQAKFHALRTAACTPAPA